MHQRCCLQGESSVLYTTSCKHSLVLLRMGEIIARDMLSWLKLFIKLLLLHLVGCLYCYRFVMSVRLSAWNNSAPTGCIFMKFDVWVFFENVSKKFNFHDENSTRISGTLQEDQYTFFTISRSVLLRMRNVSDEKFRENQNINVIFSNFFSFSKIVPFMR